MSLFQFQVKIGGEECLAVRISYTGELGWEIYMAKDKMKPVYKSLLENGEFFDVVVVVVVVTFADDIELVVVIVLVAVNVGDGQSEF
jgi:hypothetical protein